MHAHSFLVPPLLVYYTNVMFLFSLCYARRKVCEKFVLLAK